MYIGLKKEIKAYCDEGYIKIVNSNSGAFRILSKKATVLIYLLKGCRKLDEVQYEFSYLTNCEAKIFKKIIAELAGYVFLNNDMIFETGINEIDRNQIASSRSVSDAVFVKQPKNIFIKVTNLCDKKCRYCSEMEYISSKTSGDFPVKLVERVLKNMDVSKINVELTGGEPLQCSNLDQILDEFARFGMSVSLITKACSNYDYFEKIIIRNISQVCFSLDSYKEMYVNYITSRKGIFFNIMECMKIAKRNNVCVDINAVITTKNLFDIEELVLFSIENHVSNLHLTTVWCTNDIDRNLLLNTGEKAAIYAQVNYLREKYAKFIAIELTTTADCEADNRCVNCGKPFTDVKINHEGDVTLCNGDIIGNLETMSLAEIWNSRYVRNKKIKLLKQMAT